MPRFAIPSQLKTLAELFSPYATLYAVGGFVRDGIMEIACHDIDICSKLKVDDVKKALLNSDFVVLDKSLRMGTVIIVSGAFKAEYTTFRQDSYAAGRGTHSPETVSFTDDIMRDALRRDFACNAVYLDILTGDIVDPLGGVRDIKQKTLRYAKEDVFEADGLRILRLVRFGAELGFAPDADTLASARENAWRVRDISAERIREELVGCFKADMKHPELKRTGAHLEAFEALDDLGLVDILLPELAALKGLPQPPKYHLYDAYRHSVKAFELAPPHLRWAALLHDVGKAPAVARYGNMHGHDVIGEEIVKCVLTRLRFSKESIRRVSQLVRWHMVDINGNMSEAKLRRFVLEHADIIEDLCTLIEVDGVASAGKLTRTNRVRAAYESMLALEVPFKISELSVNGGDLIALGVPEKDRAALMGELLAETAMNPALKDRQRALEYLKKKAAKL